MRLQSQVKALILEDELGKQNFHEDMKTVLEPVTDIVKDVFKEKAFSMKETSIKKTEALESLSKKLLENWNNRGIIATYLLSAIKNLQS